MSCQCCVSNVPLFTKVLQHLNIGKEPWATFIFAPSHLVLHFASTDQSLTATATIPKDSVFSEYNITENPRFMVSVSALYGAFTICEGAGRNSSSSTTSSTAKFFMSYPDTQGGGKLVIETRMASKVAQCLLLTRSVKERLLDLRFSDALVPNVVHLRPEIAKEVISDIHSFQAELLGILFTSNVVSFQGLGSPHGFVALDIVEGGKSGQYSASSGVTKFEVGDVSLQAKYSLSHVMHALMTTAGNTTNAGAYHAMTTATQANPNQSPQGVGFGPLMSYKYQGGGGGSGGSMSVAPADDSLFPEVKVAMNAERMLCVTHQSSIVEEGQDASPPPVQVKITILPLSSFLEEME